MGVEQALSKDAGLGKVAGRKTLREGQILFRQGRAIGSFPTGVSIRRVDTNQTLRVCKDRQAWRLLKCLVPSRGQA